MLVNLCPNVIVTIGIIANIPSIIPGERFACELSCTPSNWAS
jgi:hypothetical protein